MSSWTTQLKESRIPYPQKHFLELEIQQDLQCAPEKHEGFSDSDLTELENIHSTRVFLFLEQIGPRKKYVETFVAFIPLILAVTLLTKEGSMIDFIREGGVGMYAILAIGIFLFGREMNHIFRLIIVKDHTQDNLRLDTSSVLLGCLALMFFGIGWSVLGIYISANAAIASNASAQIMMIGIKESLTPTILSALLSAVIVLAHYSTRRIMHIWNAPLTD